MKTAVACSRVSALLLLLPLPLVLAAAALAEGQKSMPTQSIKVMPFEHPSWEPDEAMKARALKRAYELSGNKMCCDSIDLSSDPVVHPEFDERVPVPPPMDENVKNHIDEQADKPVRPRQKLMHRVEAEPEDICARHHMHRVEYRKAWRCRK